MPKKLWPCDGLDAEMAIRHFASGKHLLGAMSTEQRDWCFDEIKRFMPEQNRSALAALNDDALARWVLKSWRYSVRF